MNFLDRLNFQTKIMLITFAMILFVVVSGGIAIEKLILPVMERDVQQETWRVASGVREQTRELPGENAESFLRERLFLILQVRAKLRYVQLTFKDGASPLWVGDEKYSRDADAKFLQKTAEGTLLLRNFAPDDPIYEVSLPVENLPAGTNAVTGLRVGMSAASVQRLGTNLFRALFTITLMILASSYFLIRWFTGMITLPVSRLLGMIDSMAKGKMDFSLEDVPAEAEVGDSEPIDIYRGTGRDELSTLLSAFRYMAARIRHFQEKLRERYEFEERLLDACPDGIIANDRNGNLILCSKGACRLLGYTAEEILSGRHVREIYPPNEPKRIKKALLSEEHGGRGILVDHTTQLITKDRGPVSVRLSAAILHEKNQEIAVVGFFHDLTELNQHINALMNTNERLNEANNQLAQLNHRYMEMLSFVTHELKSPIANGYMSANALRQQVFGPLVPEQSAMVEAVCRNLEMSMDMIRHYLDLSRIEKDELPVQPQTTLLLDEVIEPVLKGLAGMIMDREVTITREVSPELKCMVDPELFRGVFTNLVSNALRYGVKNGIIRITAAHLGNCCRMEVWNNGPGIREEDKNKLFKKFQRLQPQQFSSIRGTGLGLFLTKIVVELHGGKIRVESEEGQWASFIIELPPEGIEGFRN